MSTTRMKLEATGDLTKGVDELIKMIKEARTKHIENRAEIKEYVNKLIKVQDECEQTITKTRAIIPLHAEAAAQTDINIFLEKWQPCKANFAPLHAFVTLQDKMHRTDIDPIPDSIKKNILPDTLATLESMQEMTTKLKSDMMLLFRRVLKNHNSGNNIVKAQEVKINEKENKQGDGAVYPAPSAQVTTVHKPAISSMHGANNVRSQEKAANANRVPSSTVAQQNNQTAKK